MCMLLSMMQIAFAVKLPAEVKRKKAVFVSRCPVLDVYSQGETEDKAIKNLKEALSLFLLSCFERETLSKVLKDAGFIPLHEKPKKSVSSAKKYRTINVPLPFSASPKATRSLHCHA